MTIVERRPNELVRIKREFLKPFEATNTAEFVFKPEAECGSLGEQMATPERESPSAAMAASEERSRV